ncbi:tRNA lysidine(34) synthetase TilS [Enterobacteriaceae endosymbiont of Plateumaris braccata]|uniref:tRNA lysidine(34) synthetase TilS n=1 Tax=Enterobacteriaceae endosymbiont of Plateumaris braccata TaxID=2675793 RepID=UPI001449C403|nr:tRNA lysidine(34) synthetase TilS [Enterobacteriaceae endosymbiont of Plateumaris braccata]QJC28183.1 tRNA lysidine(34) synthetase TilS [Enterobacteriaceae endosymbiont of Plateumaris braccata]
MIFKKKTQFILHKFQKILVAYSGGLDSTVLLYNLVKLRKIYPYIKLRAIHVNHNLNFYSNQWSKMCFLQCQKWNIPFICKNIILNKKQGNIEEKARLERYKIFNDFIENNEIIVTAHHLDDHYETILLFLKRGSGLKGLSGISQINIINKLRLFRPLLDISRKELLHYAINNNLHWVEDQSNLNNKYDRNFLRNVILPQIHNRWPFFKKSVLKTSSICREQEELITELLNSVMKRLIQSNNSLFFIPLYKFSIVKRNSIIRKWIEFNQCQMPSKKILSIIWKNIVCSKSDYKSYLKIGIYQIRKYNFHLFCIKNFFTLKNKVYYWSNISLPFILPNNLGKLFILNKYKKNTLQIRKPKNKEKVYIKFFVTGEYFFLNNMKKKTKIHDIWKKLNIPIWERYNIPLLFYNNLFIAELKNNIVTLEGNDNKEKIFIFWNKKNIN